MLSAKDLLATHPLLDQQHLTEQARLMRLRHLDKYKAAELAAGRLVRIRIEVPNDEPHILLVPARVAAYVCQIVGPATAKGIRVTLSTKGSTSSALYPVKKIYPATLALISHSRAVVKRECRREGKPMPSREQLRQLGS